MKTFHCRKLSTFLIKWQHLQFWQVKYIKKLNTHLINLKKWNKFKKSQNILRFKNILLTGSIKPNWTPIALWTGKLWSLPYLLTVVNLHRGVKWVGSFLKNFQKGGEGKHLSKVSMILYIVFFSNWISYWYHFLPAFSCLITK